MELPGLHEAALLLHGGVDAFLVTQRRIIGHAIQDLRHTLLVAARFDAPVSRGETVLESGFDDGRFEDLAHIHFIDHVDKLVGGLPGAVLNLFVNHVFHILDHLAIILAGEIGHENAGRIDALVHVGVAVVVGGDAAIARDQLLHHARQVERLLLIRSAHVREELVLEHREDRVDL